MPQVVVVTFPWGHVILSAVLAAFYLATGAGKVLGLAYAQKQQRAMRVSPAFWRLTGSLEWLGALGLIVGIWVPWIGLAAAIGLALFMIGAAVARVRAARLSGKFPPGALAKGVALDAVVFVVVAVLAILIARGI